jgi:hypothetical protein
VKFKTEEGELFSRSRRMVGGWHGSLVEVLEIANDVAYGLGANLFTESSSRAIRVAHALEAGSVWVRLCCCLRLILN